MYFTKLQLADHQLPSFPLDFISNGMDKIENHVYFISEEKETVKYSTTGCIINIPMFETNEAEVKKLCKKLAKFALKDKDYYNHNRQKTGLQSREPLIIFKKNKVGIAIL